MNNRSTTIDIVRGLGILGVLTAHFFTGGEGSAYAHIKIFLFSGFLVTLFFILGGLIIRGRELQKYTVYQFITNKTTRLLIPALTYSFFYFAMNLLAYYMLKACGKTPFYPHMPGLKSITVQDFFIALLFSNDAHYIQAGIFGALYFIPAYFTASVLFFTALKLQNKYLKFFLFFIFAPYSALAITKAFGYQNVPWGFNIALLMMPVMWLGIFYTRAESLLSSFKQKNISIFTFSICLSLAVLFYCKEYGGAIHACYLYSPFTFYPLVILGFLVSLSISIFIADSRNLARILTTVGKYTLPIYGFHMFILDYYKIFIYRFPMQSVRVFAADWPWLSYCFYVLITVTGIIFISKVSFEKNKFCRRAFLGM
jgi:fucose 4-O-acetylase-like acetyltransferase